MPPRARPKTPDYAVTDLEKGLAGYVEEVGTAIAYNFGVYSALPLGNAVRASGIIF